MFFFCGLSIDMFFVKVVKALLSLKVPDQKCAARDSSKVNASARAANKFRFR